MVRPLFTATLLVLLAAPLAEAQQTPAKTKVKTKRAAANATSSPPAAPAALPAPPPGGPVGPGGPRPPHPSPGGPGAKGRVQALSEFSGTLGAYTTDNDEQVYNGFTLKTNAGTETVRFPSHLGQALMAAAKAGSTVSVTGFRHTDPAGSTALHLVSLTAGGQTVQTTLAPPPPPAAAPAAASAEGTISRLAADPQGHTRAVVLNDGTVLRLPPAAVEQLADKLKVGARVAATGNLRPRPEGEVALRPVRVLHTQTLTLDGVQFLVR